MSTSWLRPRRSLAGIVAIAGALYVIALPLVSARYPLMTDAPFHAANAAILRHYADPAWHFREQFSLQLFAVPYLPLYAIAAAAMTVMSAPAALKLAAAAMIALLPLGLAVLAWGMKKSPALGAAALPLAWGGLTSWGFLNFLGALGLYAAALGVALRHADRPSRGRAAALSALLVAILFTHPFRFPFAVLGAAAAAIATYPATRRVRLGPLVLPCALFAAWWLARPATLGGAVEPSLHLERLAETHWLLHAWNDPREAGAAEHAARWLGYAAIAFAALRVGRACSRREQRFAAGAAAVAGGSALLFLGLYLSLPMEIGVWWYVYPRELTAAAYLALALVPDLPRGRRLRAIGAAALVAAALPPCRLAADHWRAFDRETRDFAAIAERLPRAPKLLYLVFDRAGAGAAQPPFLHLPAYVQAEKGGWLSFHFAIWGASPIVYRDASEPGAVVPPPVPPRWEWTPEKFDVKRNGAFFDWFLIRSRADPRRLFYADPAIEPVAREGSWWLYRRR